MQEMVDVTMIEVTRTITFNTPARLVWQVMTDTSDWSWRTGLDRIETDTDGQVFYEYDKHGGMLHFAIVEATPYARYALLMDNDNMHGTFTGTFTESGGQTTLVLTERVFPKKWWQKPFARRYLKRHQDAYVHDLQARVTAVSER